MLEHCPEEDLPWIVDELFSFAKKFVFASVANYPAVKRLPNGENAHCTQLESGWWQTLFDTVASRYPQIEWEVWCVSRRGPAEAPFYVEDRLGSSQSIAAMEAK